MGVVVTPVFPEGPSLGVACCALARVEHGVLGIDAVPHACGAQAYTPDDQTGGTRGGWDMIVRVRRDKRYTRRHRADGVRRQLP